MTSRAVFHFSASRTVPDQAVERSSVQHPFSLSSDKATGPVSLGHSDPWAGSHASFPPRACITTPHLFYDLHAAPPPPSIYLATAFAFTQLEEADDSSDDDWGEPGTVVPIGDDEPFSDEEEEVTRSGPGTAPISGYPCAALQGASPRNEHLRFLSTLRDDLFCPDDTVGNHEADSGWPLSSSHQYSTTEPENEPAPRYRKPSLGSMDTNSDEEYDADSVCDDEYCQRCRINAYVNERKRFVCTTVDCIICHPEEDSDVEDNEALYVRTHSESECSDDSDEEHRYAAPTENSLYASNAHVDSPYDLSTYRFPSRSQSPAADDRASSAPLDQGLSSSPFLYAWWVVAFIARYTTVRPTHEMIELLRDAEPIETIKSAPWVRSAALGAAHRMDDITADCPEVCSVPTFLALAFVHAFHEEVARITGTAAEPRSRKVVREVQFGTDVYGREVSEEEQEDTFYAQRIRRRLRAIYAATNAANVQEANS